MEVFDDRIIVVHIKLFLRSLLLAVNFIFYH